MQSPDPWRIEIFCYELPNDRDELLGSLCGEMLGYLHKLALVHAGLVEAMELWDARASLEIAEYHLEHYLNYVYALRERAVDALRVLTGSAKLKASQVVSQAARLQKAAPNETPLLLQLLNSIFDDIKLRNRLIHSQCFHLWLFDGDEVFEPENILVQCQADDKVVARLRELLKRFLEPYLDRISDITGIVEKYVVTIERIDPQQGH